MSVLDVAPSAPPLVPATNEGPHNTFVCPLLTDMYQVRHRGDRALAGRILSRARSRALLLAGLPCGSSRGQPPHTCHPHPF